MFVFVTKKSGAHTYTTTFAFIFRQVQRYFHTDADTEHQADFSLLGMNHLFLNLLFSEKKSCVHTNTSTFSFIFHLVQHGSFTLTLMIKYCGAALKNIYLNKIDHEFRCK